MLKKPADKTKNEDQQFKAKRKLSSIAFNWSISIIYS